MKLPKPISRLWKRFKKAKNLRRFLGRAFLGHPGFAAAGLASRIRLAREGVGAAAFEALDRGERDAALALRAAVFVTEQGVPASVEFDAEDEAAGLHVDARIAAQGDAARKCRDAVGDDSLLEVVVVAAAAGDEQSLEGFRRRGGGIGLFFIG